MIPGFRMGLVAASALHTVKDPDFASVVFLLNGNRLGDDSSYAHTVVNHGTSLVTSDPDFPQGAVQVAVLAGPQPGYAEVVTFGTEFDWGAGDFTFEFDYKATSYFSGDPLVVGTYSTFSANGGVGFFDNASFGSGALSLAANGALTAVSVPSTVNTLMSLAFSRVGTNLYVFNHGVLIQTITGYTAHLKTPVSLRIGANATNGVSNQFTGRIGKVRITKGVGRYAASYTPTVGKYPTS